MARKKTRMLTCKVTPGVYAAFQVATLMRGGTMSGLIHMFVIRTIDEEKKRKPEEFEKALQSGVPVASKTLKLKSLSKRKRA